jgi:tetratricopeptide (TPR) repeat protein
LKSPRITWPFFVAALLASAPLAAQTPNHKHYEDAPQAAKPAPDGRVAPRLQNLGKHTFPVTSSSQDAQLFINQGVNLAYGFNHAEAERSFAEAARLDPNCAMAYWGQALVLGPNINAPMDPAAEPKAYEMIQKAVSLKERASPRERDYISALAQRYSGKAEDRKARDLAYANAMRELANKYPDDLDAATMFAESLMDLMPWAYWTRDGIPYAATNEIIAALERVMKGNPLHPGALHYWIHLWEPTKTPERAEDAADKLLPLVPGAGHMVHMPGHIYQRVGRYVDNLKANRLAVAADEDYIAQCRAQGLYPLGYYPHNIHFIWVAATMAGQSQVAIDAAGKTAASIPRAAVKDLPFLQGFLVVPDYALVRFGKWDEILALPPPHYDSPFTRGIRHYARATALIGKGNLVAAERELAALRKIVANPALDKMPASFSSNTAKDILSIAPEIVAGEIAAKRRNFPVAIGHLSKAVRLHDALIYTEPDDWHFPARHVLGAVLLEAGQAREAEVVYWEDLSKWPENGWALYGLWQSLKAQGKDDQAAEVQKRLEKAWATADVKLTASRF